MLLGKQMKKLNYRLKQGDTTIAEGIVQVTTTEDRYVMVKIYKDLANKNINRRFWFRKIDANNYSSRTGFTLHVKELDNE